MAFERSALGPVRGRGLSIGPRDLGSSPNLKNILPSLQSTLTMPRYSGTQTPSQETKDEAARIARSTQRPGQTKEQTKLIAQGIEKGIDLYKKQQKAKARELDRKLKSLARQQNLPEEPTPQAEERPTPERQWLPWLLLALSWLAIAVYFALNQ